MQFNNKYNSDLTNLNSHAFATAWIRFVAFIIDLVITFPLLAVLMFFLILTLGSVIDIAQYQVIIVKLFTLSFMLYFIILPATKWQATIGMKLLGVKIVDSNGEKISFYRSLIRMIVLYSPSMLICLISYIANIDKSYYGVVLGNIPFLFIFIDKQKREFYDYLCGTYVLCKMAPKESQVS